MSVGCFMGIIPSYIDEARASAVAYISAINDVLRASGQPDYVEPSALADVYENGLFGRSALDHHGASCLAKLAEIQDQTTPTHLGLLGLNPYRVAFLPADFAHPLTTAHEEQIFDQLVTLNVGSAPRLLRDLAVVATKIGIPLEDGALAGTIAEQINDFAPLFEGDDCEFAEDERTAWLVLYEGARLAVRHRIALSLAG